MALPPNQSTWQISLDRLAQLIFSYLCDVKRYDEQGIKTMLIEDVMSVRGRKMPSFLRKLRAKKEQHEVKM